MSPRSYLFLTLIGLPWAMPLSAQSSKNPVGLESLSTSFEALADKVGPAVVQILATGYDTSHWYRNRWPGSGPPQALARAWMGRSAEALQSQPGSLTIGLRVAWPRASNERHVASRTHDQAFLGRSKRYRASTLGKPAGSFKYPSAETVSRYLLSGESPSGRDPQTSVRNDPSPTTMGPAIKTLQVPARPLREGAIRDAVIARPGQSFDQEESNESEESALA